MTNLNRIPALLAFARCSDDLEAAASLDAKLLEAGQAASLLADPADRQIADLRLEHGAEDWDTVAWGPVTMELEFLFSEERRLRTEARRQRDEAAETLLALRAAG